MRDRYQAAQTKMVLTHQSESWTLAFVACDPPNFQAKHCGAARTAGYACW